MNSDLCRSVLQTSAALAAQTSPIDVFLVGRLADELRETSSVGLGDTLRKDFASLRQILKVSKHEEFVKALQEPLVRKYEIDIALQARLASGLIIRTPTGFASGFVEPPDQPETVLQRTMQSVGNSPTTTRNDQ